MKQKASDIAPIIASVIKREALPEQIVRQLLGLVRAGQLKPGDRLPAERALAADLGVGRPTLREALRALQLLGVLDIRHGGGVFVNEPGPDALLGPAYPFIDADRLGLDAIFEARRVIEGALLAFVARHIDAGTIRRLEANLDELGDLIARSRRGKPDIHELDALAAQFRAIIGDAVGNPVLTRAVQSLDALGAATRRRVTGAGSVARLLRNHRRIVEALVARDPRAAQRALEAHIDYLAQVCGAAHRAVAHA
ncbi:MAG: HTH-type transcriptional regulator LutR [Steroidobacteraceae bacterium]|nr:HTH-type transcriptional regulator LutR [Steroidobacteraceae bacterium]